MSKSSPFETVHERMGANFAEYDGWNLPKDFGDPAAEARALEQGSAAFDLSSFGRITIKGTEADDLMDNLVGAGEKPIEGKWQRMSIKANQDKDLRIGKVKGSFLILTLPSQLGDVLSDIRACSEQKQFSNVLITDITDKTAMLGIYGPQAVQAVDNILPFDISEVEPESITLMSFFMISITILRGGWCGTDGIELLCPASAAPMAAGAVAKYHERENITAAGMDCLLNSMK